MPGKRRCVRTSLFSCFFALAAGMGATAQSVLAIDTSLVVGSIPAKFSVNQGAASYSIPIGLPAGVAGMKPDLAIAYNSNGGNGPLGIGFQLNGLSQIHRCGASIAQDGFKGGTYFDERDRYCIDGQRLVAINGAPGAEGTEYRTEIDTFSKIVSHNDGSANGPLYWEVWTKSGQHMRYGETQEARFQITKGSLAHVYRWGISTVEDTTPAGNSINFRYQKPTGGDNFLLQGLDYADVSVDLTFSEIDRQDPIVAYLPGGGKSVIKHLLDRVEVAYSGQLLTQYQLNYQNSALTQRSHLVSLHKCNADGECLPQTRFNWNEEKAGFEPSQTFALPMDFTERDKQGSYVFAKSRGLRVADFNGDGLPDILRIKKDTRKLWLNNGQNWQENYSPHTDFYNSKAYKFKDDEEDNGLRLADIDVDGSVDLVNPNYDAALSGGLQEATSHALPPVNDRAGEKKGQAFIQTGFRLTDINGDYLPDVVQGTGELPYQVITPEALQSNSFVKDYFCYVDNGQDSAPTICPGGLIKKRCDMADTQTCVYTLEFEGRTFLPTETGIYPITGSYFDRHGSNIDTSENYISLGYPIKAFISNVDTYPSLKLIRESDYSFPESHLISGQESANYRLNRLHDQDLTGNYWGETDDGSEISLPLALDYPYDSRGDGDLYTSPARVVDIDGDSLNDILLSKRDALGTYFSSVCNLYSSDDCREEIRFRDKVATTYNQTWLNTSSNWQQTSAYELPEPFSYFGEDAGNTRLIDVNGDGLQDAVVTLLPEDKGEKVYLYDNDPDGVRHGVTGPIGAIRREGNLDTYARYNQTGDKGSDCVFGSYGFSENRIRVASKCTAALRWYRIDELETVVYINDGTQFVRDNQWDLNSIGLYGSELVDLNGDGLPDLVHKLPWHQKSYLNTGTGWIESTVQLPRPLMGEELAANQGTQFADVNGDGAADFLYGYDGDLGVWESQSEDLRVQSIVDGLGSEIAISYSPTTDTTVYTKENDATYPLFDSSGASYLVSATSTDNAVGGKNITTYQYSGLKQHLQGRGGLGFRQITRTEENTGISVATTYNQDYPFTGQVATVEKRTPDGQLLSHTETNLAVRIQHTVNRSTPLGDSHVLNVLFPFVTSSTQSDWDLDGTQLKTVTTENSDYDDYGNVRHVLVTTTGNGETFTTETTNSYENWDTSWMLGRLVRSTATQTAYGQSQSRTSAFEYDSITGLLTTEIIEPDDSGTMWQKTTYSYDSFGNKIKTVVSARDIDGNLITRQSSSTYSTDGRLPVSSTNALGHTENYTHDNRCGLNQSLTGPNGLTTSWDYDLQCRKVKETRADGTYSKVEREWVVGDEYAPEDAIYKVTALAFAGDNSEDLSQRKTTYFNLLGREIRTRTTGYDGRAIYEDKHYDALGRIQSATLPYYDGEAWHDFSVETEYDLLNRPVSVSRPGVAGRAVNSVVYNGLTTTETDALGRSTTTTKNALDKVSRIDQPLNTFVEHTYDPYGNLIKTTTGGPDKTVDTFMTYDSRGRKIAMDDPGMGHWDYSYNGFGELIWQKDAKSQIVKLYYDGLGRKIHREEFTSESDTSPDTSSWHYDSDGERETGKSIGKLVRVTSPGYTETHTFDQLGRPQSSTTAMDGGETFTVSNSYDAHGRVISQTRPNGFVIENHYNAFGFLESIGSPSVTRSTTEIDQLVSMADQATTDATDALAIAEQYLAYEQELRAYAEEYANREETTGSYGNIQIDAQSSVTDLSLTDAATLLSGDYLLQFKAGSALTNLQENTPYSLYTETEPHVIALPDSTTNSYYSFNSIAVGQPLPQGSPTDQLIKNNKTAWYWPSYEKGLIITDDGMPYDWTGTTPVDSLSESPDVSVAHTIDNISSDLQPHLSATATYHLYKDSNGDYTLELKPQYRTDALHAIKMEAEVKTFWRWSWKTGNYLAKPINATEWAARKPNLELQSQIGRWLSLSDTKGQLLLVNADAAVNVTLNLYLNAKAEGRFIPLTTPPAGIETNTGYALYSYPTPRYIAFDGQHYRIQYEAEGVDGNQHYTITLSPVTSEEWSNISTSPSSLNAFYWTQSTPQGLLFTTKTTLPTDEPDELLQTTIDTVADTADSAIYDQQSDSVTTSNTESSIVQQLNAMAEEAKNGADTYLEYAQELITLAEAVYRYADSVDYWQHAENGSSSIADDGTDYTTFWRANAYDAAGRLRSFTQGNGLTTTNNYDAASGQLWGIQTGSGYNHLIRDLSYMYDDANNVTWRADLVQDTQESFTYDALERVTNATIDGYIEGIHWNQSLNLSYDSLGNITHKSDVGDYSYGNQARTVNNAGPHAVLTAGANYNFQYDANGNALDDGMRQYQYGIHNKPTQLTQGDSQVNFTYGAERNRYKKTTSSGETTYYLGKFYEKIIEPDGRSYKHKHFINAGGQAIAIHTQFDHYDDRTTTQADSTSYLHHDNLGSVDTITNTMGQITERLSYDAFGKRRNANWKAIDNTNVINGLLAETVQATNRGYTGHEHIDEMGLIHMNARIYDPVLGRFLTPDTIVQLENDGQTFNRYAYGRNNPLRYTDPSGHFLPALLTPFFISMAVVSFMYTLHVTGDDFGAAFKGLAFSLLSAGLASWVEGLNLLNLGGLIEKLDLVKSVVHGLTQGALSELAGGDFKSSFIGAFVGHTAGAFMKNTGFGKEFFGKVGNSDPILKARRTVFVSVVGGTAAKLGGGKFANGAITAAFVHLFNAESATHSHKSSKHTLYETRSRFEVRIKADGKWRTVLQYPGVPSSLKAPTPAQLIDLALTVIDPQVQYQTIVVEYVEVFDGWQYDQWGSFDENHEWVPDKYSTRYNEELYAEDVYSRQIKSYTYKDFRGCVFNGEVCID